jgi:3'(2'), 5'-bisphosphate nucleotidase
MTSKPFTLEKEIGIAAVLRACKLTHQVSQSLTSDEKVTKDDKSPVTIADYASQALVNTILAKTFPDDPIVGEEDATTLREESSTTLRERITSLANEALKEPAGEGEKDEWGIGKAYSTDELLNAIDRGSYEGGNTGRMWTLDPIDGTKGFIRKEQYAVCLALIENSIVQLGIMGCPNLPVDPSKPNGEKGCLFVAVRGQGAEQLSISSPKSPTIPLKLTSTPKQVFSLRVLQSVEKGHSALSFNTIVSGILNITAPPIEMDSQAKYCSLARGDGDIYLRMPVAGLGYREKIWDHAAGAILIEESGGKVTDSLGQPLNFGLGRTLGENNGVVASSSEELHVRVIDAIREAKKKQEESK